jgi:cysteine desulfuration protein SufE
MNPDINTIQEQILQEFSTLNDWFDQYEHLISLGKKLKPLDEQLKSEENRISGCQSQVWLTEEKKDDKLIYSADSDSVLIKGMISLLLRVVNNQTPKDILTSELYFIKKIGLSSNLSPSRTNGILAILKQIKAHAKKHTRSK